MTKQTELPKIKPCPFCGSKAKIHSTIQAAFEVYCSTCGSNGPLRQIQADAIRKWNVALRKPTRTAPKPKRVAR